MKKFIPARSIKVSTVQCDVCKKEYDLTKDDKYFSVASEAQEFQSLSWEAGYGASKQTIFQDGHRYELDICQTCLNEKLGEFIRDLGPFRSSSEDQAKAEIIGTDESAEIRANLDMLDS